MKINESQSQERGVKATGNSLGKEICPLHSHTEVALIHGCLDEKILNHRPEGDQRQKHRDLHLVQLGLQTHVDDY